MLEGTAPIEKGPAESAVVESNGHHRGERVAPVWHTVIVVLLFLFPPYRLFPIGKWFSTTGRGEVPFLYIIELQYQWILFLFVYFGLTESGGGLKGLIGRTWKKREHAARDIGLALILFFINTGIGALLVFLGFHGHKAADRFLPRSALELAAILPVMISAGICEEIIFRGYLQKQFQSLTGSVMLALLLQAAVFSLAHGYDQTIAGFANQFLYGMLAGLLAVWRKSLIPGIISHSFQDTLIAYLSMMFSMAGL